MEGRHNRYINQNNTRCAYVSVVEEGQQVHEDSAISRGAEEDIAVLVVDGRHVAQDVQQSDH